MPNHVKNIIDFTGDAEKIKKMLFEVKIDKEDFGTIDFNKIIPMPETLDIESGGHQSEAVNAYLSAVSPHNTEDYGVEKISKEEYANYVRLLRELQSPSILYANLDSTLSLERINEISKKYFEESKNGPFSVYFNRGDLFQLGKMVLENIANYGCADWYSWRIEHWGTKWNSYNAEPKTIGDKEISFDTAWSAPHEVIFELSKKYPDIHIHHRWADEDIGANCGEAKYYNGKEELFNYKEGEDATVFALETWGYDSSEYYTKNGYSIYMGDIPDTIPKEEVQKWIKKGIDTSKIPELKKTDDGNGYDISLWSIGEKTALLDELYQKEIDLWDIIYS